MITFRTMTMDDVPRVAKLEALIFPDPWSEKVYRETLPLPGVRYIVACDTDADDSSGLKVIGAAGVRNIVGTGEITNVMLLPEYRGKGTGRQMMEELLEQGRLLGAKDFTLEVRQSNKTAVKLYESLGFECEGIRKDFYRNPREDALIMWLYTQ